MDEIRSFKRTNLRSSNINNEGRASTQLMKDQLRVRLHSIILCISIKAVLLLYQK